MTKDKALATVEVQGVAVAPEVADFFKSNADVGSNNLGGSIPQLKVTEANSQNEMQDGQYAPAGTLYYMPTKETFEAVDVSIITTSRGFYALDNQKEPKPKFTQLVGGMLLDSMQPFVMFMSGTRLQGLWDFGKEIKAFTKSKASPIPMFAIKVALVPRRVTTNFGVNHVVDFKVSKKDGNIMVINDIDMLTLLRNGVDQLEDTFESFIKLKEVDRVTGKPLHGSDEPTPIQSTQVDDLNDVFPPEE